MIVTHAINGDGNRRVYLGGKASIECWIEPSDDGCAWSFHVEPAPTCGPLPEASLRAYATHILMSLSDALHCPPGELKTVPFECIAALHTADPPAGRRPAPRRHDYEQSFITTPPDITKPNAGHDSGRRTGFSRHRTS